MPSVPKYLRAIFPHRQLPSGNINCFGLKPASKNIQECYRAGNPSSTQSAEIRQANQQYALFGGRRRCAPA
jgi:hypothetical protein